jgi:hypothetical protein
MNPFIGARRTTQPNFDLLNLNAPAPEQFTYRPQQAPVPIGPQSAPIPVPIERPAAPVPMPPQRPNMNGVQFERAINNLAPTATNPALDFMQKQAAIRDGYAAFAPDVRGPTAAPAQFSLADMFRFGR